MITKATIFAAKAHENQTRKGTDIPYILHPMEAAVIVSQMKHDINLICAALLHDVIEDAGVTYEYLVAEFGKRIAALVLSQSEDKSKSWEERKQHTIEELNRTEDEDIKIVCIADKLANLRSISRELAVFAGNEEEFWQRFNRGKAKQSWYYQGLCEGFASLGKFSAYQEFKTLVSEVFHPLARGY
jgi:myo-inositol-1(or 4)-monophosphatase